MQVGRVATTADRWAAPGRTPAHGLASAGTSRDALGVFKERLTFARWLRTCPVCRSDAVREVRSEPVDEGLVHCLVSCGQCETWRAVFATCRVGRRLERRLERRRRRDRRRIDRALRAWAANGPSSATSVERAADRLGLANDGALRMDP